MESLAKHTPYLLTACNDNSKEDGRFTLYNIADKIHYEFDEPFLHEKRIIGSQYGWLVVLDKHCEIFLLNPLTHESIPLPSITTIRKIRPCHSIDTGDMVSYFVCTSTMLDFPFYNFMLNYCFQEFAFTKVVVSSSPSISSSNFNVAALYGSRPSHLVVTREGEGRWTLLQEIAVRYLDIMFRRDGKLLCLTDMGALREVEFKDNDDIVIINISAPNLAKSLQVDDSDDLYLAEDCTGRVLTVHRTNEYDVDDDDIIIYDVKVFRFISGNGEEDKWEPVMSLDGEAIFAGANASVFLAKEYIHGAINSNTVYILDEWLGVSEAREWNYEICAYNLTNKSIEPCRPVELQRCTRSLPAWIIYQAPISILFSPESGIYHQFH